MSRIVVFGIDQRSDGELTAMFDRGWMLAGHPAVTGGGSTVLSMTTAEQASKAYWQFGRMILVAHEKLPDWVGMIDPPWKPTLPVNVAVYNAEYLLSLRSPDQPAVLEGSVGEIAAQMVEMFNAGDDLFVRIGDISQADPTPRQEALDGRTYWEQLKALLERSGCEMQVRAGKDPYGRLIIYLDIAMRLGMDTGFLYFDGPQGNMTIGDQDAVLDGPIINRVIGAGDESGQASRLTTAPFVDDASKMLYRLRSELVQFRGVREQSTLEQYSQAYLTHQAAPRFSFLMNILDKGDAFINARLGNTAWVHISEAYLPGGVQGWQGKARIVAMAYAESQNLLTAKMEVV